MVGFPFCLVPFLSLPCLSTHQHLFNLGRHWISAKPPSSLHLGTAITSSECRYLISSRLFSQVVKAGKWNKGLMRIVFIQIPGLRLKNISKITGWRSNLMDITNHVDLVLGFLCRHSTLVCRNHKDWLYSWHFYHFHTWQACKGLGCISTALVHSLDKLRNKEKIYRQRSPLEEAGNSFLHVANCYIWNDECYHCLSNK